MYAKKKHCCHTMSLHLRFNSFSAIQLIKKTNMVIFRQLLEILTVDRRSYKSWFMLLGTGNSIKSSIKTTTF